VNVVLKGTYVVGCISCGVVLAPSAVSGSVVAMVDGTIGAEAAGATRLILPADMVDLRSHGGLLRPYVTERRKLT
jgi:hypothetical protein